MRQAEEIGIVSQRFDQQCLQVGGRDVRCGLSEGGAEQATVEIREWRPDEVRAANQEVPFDFERQQKGQFSVQLTFDDGDRMGVGPYPGLAPVVALVERIPRLGLELAPSALQRFHGMVHANGERARGRLALRAAARSGGCTFGQILGKCHRIMAHLGVHIPIPSGFRDGGSLCRHCEERVIVVPSGHDGRRPQ